MQVRVRCCAERRGHPTFSAKDALFDAALPDAVRQQLSNSFTSGAPLQDVPDHSTTDIGVGSGSVT